MREAFGQYGHRGLPLRVARLNKGAAVIKLTFCLHRLPDLSRAEFQTYWRNTHAPLVASHAATLNIRRYVQTHALSHKADQAVAGPRGAPQAYDGIAELWFDSWDSFFAAGQNPGADLASQALIEDERKFIDLARSPLWFNQEHVILG